MSFVLLIFIKNPRLGQVKTRLARTVGDAEALRIYHLLLEKTRQAALEVKVGRWLFYSDFSETGDAWPEAEFTKFVQQGDDLGIRMQGAFHQAFDAGASRVVIIGSDCPEISGNLLEQAFAALEHTDFVLGPSFDGGYYLLGMRAFSPWVFQGIVWSTDSVFSATVKKIQAAGKSFSLLPVLRDVDTAADWEAVS
ncbi:MAG: TIGR04282 family arsenosugar biosynthesis glycosyltransferase [Lewinellaceae bacterium]|nr:TIGR04282 family arsenosugar biosynthesis glycosyltransferase [Lewinellaceae bacterium]